MYLTHKGEVACMNIVLFPYCVAEIVKSLDCLLFRFKILYIKLTYAYA